ncbi:MAG: TolC family protein [Bacteroidales bacterium]
MKRIIVLLIGCSMFSSSPGYGQLGLEYCQEKARANYPLVKQYGLIERTAALNQSSAKKGYLPQVSLSAKASYQSDVTEWPFQLPSVPYEGLSKDQYQLVAGIDQVIWDGGLIHSKLQVREMTAEVEERALEVELYALKSRVEHLFFGILLSDRQLGQLELHESDLRANETRIREFISQGLADQTDLDAILVEQFGLHQKETDLLAANRAYREMLSAFIGEPISREEVLEEPQLEPEFSRSGINRPELRLFEAQDRLLSHRERAVTAESLPKLGLFVQGGYGKPGLNMLKNEFSPFFIGGIRLAWNLGPLYTRKNELSLLAIDQQSLEIIKQAFLFNLNLSVIQARGEIDRISQLIEADNEIIRLRGDLKRAAEKKLENGTITASDLVREINAESQARQNMAIHEIQLLLAISQLKSILSAN